MTDYGDEKEDLYALATVTSNGRTVRNVPCKFYLPKAAASMPRIEMRPTEDQYLALTPSHAVSVVAEIPTGDGMNGVEVATSTAYVKTCHTRYWGPVTESFILAEPTDLIFSESWQHKGGSTGECHVTFRISPNEDLAPDLLPKLSYLGSLEIKRLRSLSVDLLPDLRITFDYHFSHSGEVTGEYRQHSFLVAQALLTHEVDKVPFIRDRLMPLLDDLLLVASLGARTRTACYGWTAADCARRVRFFRRDRQIPTGYSQRVNDQGLIRREDFSKFLDSAYKKLNEMPNKRPIRKGIVSVAPARSIIVEHDFLSMFSAFEEILLDFRRKENLEFVLPEEKWRLLRKQIEASIKANSKDVLDKEQRQWMYAKLGELNRVPLGVVFAQFQAKLGISFHRFWPLFDSGGGPSLYDIRNWLAHGEAIPSEALGALVSANEHLRHILERVVLAQLGWPPERSNAHSLSLISDDNDERQLARSRELLQSLIAHPDHD